MNIYEIIAEKKIQEVIKNGEIDNLPVKGKPLELEDLYKNKDLNLYN